MARFRNLGRCSRGTFCAIAAGAPALVAVVASVWSATPNRTGEVRGMLEATVSYTQARTSSAEPLSESAARDLAARTEHGFEENVGQLPAGVRFAARTRAATCFVDDAGFTVQLVESAAATDALVQGQVTTPSAVTVNGLNLRFTFEGAAERGASVEGRGAAQPGANYYIGADPSAWRTGVPTYTAVSIRDVAPGVDVDLRGATASRLEYDLAFAPDSDLGSVVVACEGARSLEVTADGKELVITTALGVLRQDLPGTWQTRADGSREMLDCRFRALGAGRFGFVVPGRDESLALLIDPGLIYSTFFGGSGNDRVRTAAVTSSGELIVGGHTTSTNLPTTPGAFQLASGGGVDGFVARLSADGRTLRWCTYFGGSSDDQCSGVAVSSTGAVAVAGDSASLNFPVNPGLPRVHPSSSQALGLYDAIVGYFDPSGARVFFMALGDADNDVAAAVQMDQTGIVVGGYTRSSNFPVWSGYDHNHAGSGGGYYGDGFVTRLSLSGRIVFSTFLGGAGNDAIFALALQPSGDVTVGGLSEGLPLPVPTASWNRISAGSGRHAFGDAFVARLSASGATLLYGGLLGGSGDDAAWSVALDPAGGAAVAGRSYSNDLRTTLGAAQGTFGGGVMDGLVARISPSGSALVACTYFGGTGDDDCAEIVVDGRGSVTVAGETSSPNLSTTVGCFQRNYAGGGADAFVTRLTPGLDTVIYSTFLGASAADEGQALAADELGGAYIVGATSSSAFPTTPGAYDRIYRGGRDGFVTHLDMLPSGVSRFGTSTRGCSGALANGVNSAPWIGNGAFALTCLGAPRNSLGVLGISGRELRSPLIVSGAAVWIDLTAPTVFLAVASDAFGYCERRLPIPSDVALINVQVFDQFIWPDSCASGGLSASNALAVTLY